MGRQTTCLLKMLMLPLIFNLSFALIIIQVLPLNLCDDGGILQQSDKISQQLEGVGKKQCAKQQISFSNAENQISYKTNLNIRSHRSTLRKSIFIKLQILKKKSNIRQKAIKKQIEIFVGDNKEEQVQQILKSRTNQDKQQNQNIVKTNDVGYQNQQQFNIDYSEVISRIPKINDSFEKIINKQSKNGIQQGKLNLRNKKEKIPIANQISGARKDIKQSNQAQKVPPLQNSSLPAPDPPQDLNSKPGSLIVPIKIIFKEQEQILGKSTDQNTDQHKGTNNFTVLPNDNSNNNAKKSKSTEKKIIKNIDKPALQDVTVGETGSAKKYSSLNKKAAGEKSDTKVQTLSNNFPVVGCMEDQDCKLKGRICRFNTCVKKTIYKMQQMEKQSEGKNENESKQ